MGLGRIYRLLGSGFEAWRRGFGVYGSALSVQGVTRVEGISGNGHEGLMLGLGSGL